MEVSRLFQIGRESGKPGRKFVLHANFPMTEHAEKPQLFSFNLKELLQLLHRGHENRRFLS
jgi:hypothetical protein